MASNDTAPKAKPAEGPTEPFKRAVVGCMRAIAGKPDLEVAFAADRPLLNGHKARLPEPPRKLPERVRMRAAMAPQVSATFSALSGNSWPKQR